MTTLKFTPEMFLETEHKDGFHNSRKNFASISACCAQTIFDEWLEKQPVVYGYGEDVGMWQASTVAEVTHKARLVCIEEIVAKECEHEPLSTISMIQMHITGPNEQNEYSCNSRIECKHCGKPIKAERWMEV